MTSYERLKAAVEALGTDVPRENVRELIYAARDAQGSALTTDEIESILLGLPTRLDLIEEYPGD